MIYTDEDVKKIQKRMNRACNVLNKIVKEARAEYPGAVLFLDESGTLSLFYSYPYEEVGKQKHHFDIKREICNSKLDAIGGER